MNTAFALHLKPWDGGPIIVNVSRELHETSTMSIPLQSSKKAHIKPNYVPI